jgi:chitodextrinase
MPTISRPSAATLVAIVVTLVIGSQTSFAASSNGKDRVGPAAVAAVEVSAADASSVTIEWPPSRENGGVVGYGVFVDGARVATVTPERVHRWKDRDSLSYTISGLSCGKGYTVGVDVFDRGENHSEVTSTTVSTSACPDTTAPSLPSGVRQVATTESSVVLAWSPSSDDVGVVEYGLYDSGLRVATVSEASATVAKLSCGKTYLLGIDAADAAGNRSARVDSYFRTSACPRTNQPPSTPTGLTVTAATQTGMRLAWSASTDDVAVAGYGLYVEGAPSGESNTTSGSVSGLRCGTTYTVGVDAFDGAAMRSSIAQLSAPTSPCATTPPPPPPTGSTGAVTQTIANGATLADLDDWRAVYDNNGDNVEDDPGSIQFLVDGQQVLSEINPPFGDSFATGSITVGNGSHTFEVRALNDTGTLLAKNTVTATINTQTTPPPSDTQPPTTPTNVTVSTRTTTSIALTWTASTDDVGVAGYGVYNGGELADTTAGTTGIVSGLTCGTSYTLAVDAFDGAGNSSAKTTPVMVSTLACVDTTAPSQPTNLRLISATASGATIAWNAATDNVAVTGYDVYRGTTKVGPAVPTTSYAMSGLSCGTTYTVGVTALDSAGNSSPPATTSITTTSACADTQPPTAPTNVTVSTRTTTSITLTWTASTDGVGVAGYGIYNGGATPAKTATGTTSTVSGLTCGTSYTLAVDAYDTAGNRSAKTAVTGSTLACAATPASTGYPDASNTGVPAGTTLTAYTGPSNITTPNTVIDGKTLGCVQVSAPGVVIRNSTISCSSSSYAVFVDDRLFTDAATPLLIQDSEITCNDRQSGAAVGEADFTVRRVEITHCENGFDLNQNILVEDSFIHDLYTDSVNHMDGAQEGCGHWQPGYTGPSCAAGYAPGTLNITFRHNTIYAVSASGEFGTSAYISNRTPNQDHNVLIENNLMAGGAYTLYCQQDGQTGDNYRVINNHFSTKFKSTVGFYGISAHCADETQSGNVIHETGQPIFLGG